MLEIFNHGETREIRLARAPANAFNLELAEAVYAACDDAAQVARAVVISGKPGMFSAGLDVPQLIQLDREGMFRFWQGFQRLLSRLALMPIPTVFALTGHAPAGGIVMALFGDYRIMPRGAFKTGFNEVQVGLTVPPIVYQALVRLIGAHTAERILVSGEIMDAQRALGIGLVDELADDPPGVIARAIEWCQELIALPAAAMLQTRAMARADLHRLIQNSGEQGSEEFLGVWFEESTQRVLRRLVEQLA